jgi:hypothetical protein
MKNQSRNLCPRDKMPIVTTLGMPTYQTPDLGRLAFTVQQVYSEFFEFEQVGMFLTVIYISAAK